MSNNNFKQNILTANKRKILRVVTNSEAVLWHMGKNLSYLSNDYDITVAGDNVSMHANQFPKVKWENIKIDRKISLVNDLLALAKLFFLCRRLKPDIVHSIMPKAGLLCAIAAYFARVPSRIHTFTGQVWDTKSGFSRRFLIALDRIIIALNTACLTDSPSQSNHLFNSGVHKNGKPLGVLAKGSLIGVDFERFSRVAISKRSKISRSSLGLSDKNFVILFLARKNIDKGAFDMIRAFSIAKSKAPHLSLLFVGPDESEGQLDELRSQSPDIFDGVIERGLVENHEDFIAISDVLCLPSYREGFGTIVIDAAALGVPCIGSNIPGLIDSISDFETGLLFPPGDLNKLASNLLMLDADRLELNRLGVAAENRARKYFSTEVIYDELFRFYKNTSI